MYKESNYFSVYTLQSIKLNQHDLVLRILFHFFYIMEMLSITPVGQKAIFFFGQLQCCP